jgi:hypothetical protein
VELPARLLKQVSTLRFRWLYIPVITLRVLLCRVQQRMEDLAPIMRQRGTDALGRSGPGPTNSSASGIRGTLRRSRYRDVPSAFANPLRAMHRPGLCAELQDVFSMSINERPLPFPLKDGVAAAAAAAAGRGRGRGDSAAAEVQEPSQELSVEQEDYYGEVERTRAPRDSDLSAVGAGRLSALNASSIAGKDGDSFTMDEGTRFSHGSR